MGSTEGVADFSAQLLFGIVGMVLLTVFLIVFFVVYQRRIFQEQERTNKIEADYQKSLLNAGILAQEEDRKRIAVELHDGIGGVLSATKMYVQRLDTKLSEADFIHLKSRVLEAIADNIQEVRAVTNNLLPPSLERVGLVAAVKDRCQQVADVKQMQVDFRSNEQSRFNQNREKAIFRILQELINNTLKHSNADQLDIQFHFSEDHLLVEYKENGQGFDQGTVAKRSTSGGLGLKGIESRIAFLDADFDYRTAPGQGVQVMMKCLLDPAIEL